MFVKNASLQSRADEGIHKYCKFDSVRAPLRKCGNFIPNCYRKYLQLVMVKCNDMKWSLPCVTLHLLGSLLCVIWHRMLSQQWQLWSAKWPPL